MCAANEVPGTGRSATFRRLARWMLAIVPRGLSVPNELSRRTDYVRPESAR